MTSADVDALESDELLESEELESDELLESAALLDDAGPPNRTAIAPTDSASASVPAGSLSTADGDIAHSSSGVHVVPPSPENQTPPFAAPAYTRCPPGPTAR